jgi:DNA-binding NarL/FixJ family response regulator
MVEAPQKQQPAGAVKTRVLLVDDHVVLRQGLAVMINDEPDMMVCGEADGVRSAMEAVKTGRPDVAVIDLTIKDGDGLELIKLLRDQAPKVQALVLSMFDEAVYAERALHAGAHGYIMKAEPVSNVLTGIRRVMRGERFLSPRLAARPPHGAAVGGGAGDRVAPSAAGVARLSDRELQVLRRVGCGMSTKEIAAELFISVKTVETHREHLKQKLELADSGELLRYAIAYNRLGE